jgi:hypothetical protein
MSNKTRNELMALAAEFAEQRQSGNKRRFPETLWKQAVALAQQYKELMELLLFAAIIFTRILTPVLFFFFETVRNGPFVFLSMTVKAFGCARNVFLMENLNGGPKALLNPCLSSHGISRHCLAMVIRLWLFLGVHL